MSICICDRCDRSIDSDVDTDCFIVNPYNDADVTTHCEPCRERAYDEHQERLMEDGPGPSLLDQQRDSYNIKHGIRS